MSTIEGLVSAAFKAAGALSGGRLHAPPVARAAPALPLPRITYTHAMSVYGSDKPDRRIGMPIVEAGRALAAAFRESASPASSPISSLLVRVALATVDEAASAASAAAFSDPSLSYLSLFLPNRATLRAFAVPCLGAPGVLSRKQLDAVVSDICSVSGAVPGKADQWPALSVDGVTEAVSQLASPVLHVVRVGAGSTFVGHKLAASLPVNCQAALCMSAGAVEGDLLVLVAGTGARTYAAAGSARLIAGEIARRKGFVLLPFTQGIPGMGRGEAVLVGGQLDAGYSRLDPTDVSGLVAKRRVAAGGTSAVVSESDSIDVSAAVDLFWVTDFPLFEANDSGFASVHHPFTAPAGLTELSGVEGSSLDARKLASWLETDSTAEVDLAKRNRDATILTLRAQHYDLVCNGIELGGGSVRIHDSALQAAVLERVLAVSSEQMTGFSALLTALSSGAPPHGGFALGFDRFISTLAGPACATSIRDVIAFPKSAQGNELMSGAPSRVTAAQLADLHIRVCDESASP
jgi:aspartyl-tRNA synthetase